MHNNRGKILDGIFTINDDAAFEKKAIELFRHQSTHCDIYNQFIYHLKVNTNKIKQIEDIPFLPISFFKTHKVVSEETTPDIIFSSSGTTGMTSSQHFVTNVSIYEESFETAFQQKYGPVEKLCILALLPSYLERDGSSLIYMVDMFIKQSKHPSSGYFLHNHEDLYRTLTQLKSKGQKTVLFGVTYALLDFIEQHKTDFPELIVMETGGMKGRRKEMIREELHSLLTKGFGVEKIHSEYGMTELLSQAYSPGDGLFYCPGWMKILLRDTNDPLSLIQENRSGGINVIDLANVDSCAFIATQDLGRLHSDGSFEVLGRFDNSDIRGCNLLVG